MLRTDQSPSGEAICSEESRSSASIAVNESSCPISELAWCAPMSVFTSASNGAVDDLFTGVLVMDASVVDVKRSDSDAACAFANWIGVAIANVIANRFAMTRRKSNAHLG